VRRRVKCWTASLLALVSLSMSHGGEPATLQQQPLPHHPIHSPTVTHPELVEVTETRKTDLGVSKTITRLSPMLVAPVIDGAKTPDRVPDEVALRTLFRTIALPAAPSTKEQARVDSKLARLGLDSYDVELLTQELRLYYTASTERKQRMANIRLTRRRLQSDDVDRSRRRGSGLIPACSRHLQQASKGAQPCRCPPVAGTRGPDKEADQNHATA
jgi:hypothetical protein